MNKYRVGIKKLSDRPLVGAGSDLTHEVTYSIASLDGGSVEDWDGGIVQGDTLARCLRIREVGEITVAEPFDWGDTRPELWQETIVNLALDNSSSESA